MAIKFEPPPDWLIQQYLNRPNPVVEGLQGANQIMQQYQAQKTQQQQQAIQQQQLAMLQDKNAREGREGFYSHGDIAGLPPEDQAAIGQPTQGPPTAEGQLPVVNPRIERYNQFLQKFPHGTKGREKEEANKEIPLFNEKGKPIRAETPSGLLPPNAKVVDDAVGRGGQFVGTQGNVGTYWDPNKNAFGTAPLPGGVPLEPRIAPTIPSDQANKTAELNKLLGDVEVIKANYDPSFVGVMDSRLTSAKQLTGAGATEKAAVFKSTVGGLRNKVLNLLSGAAISPEEADRLLATLPAEGRSDTDFSGNLANFERETRLIMQEKASSFGQAGYRGAENMAPRQDYSNTPGAVGGLDPAKKARLEELRAKRAAGTLR